MLRHYADVFGGDQYGGLLCSKASAIRFVGNDAEQTVIEIREGFFYSLCGQQK
jgi:hypothetical protein